MPLFNKKNFVTIPLSALLLTLITACSSDHTQMTPVDDTLVSNTAIDITWNYETSSASPIVYSAQAVADFPEEYPPVGDETWIASFDASGSVIAPEDSIVAVESVTEQSDNTYYATVKFTGYNMATTFENLSLKIQDSNNSERVATIKVTVTGAPTVTLAASAATDVTLVGGVAGFADYVYDYDYTSTYAGSDCVVYTLNNSSVVSMITDNSAVWSGVVEGMFGDGDLSSTLADAGAGMTLDSSDDNSIFVSGEVDDFVYSTSSDGKTLHAETILYTKDGVLYPAIVYNKNSPAFRFSYTDNSINDNGGVVKFGTSPSFNGVTLNDLASPVITHKSGFKIIYTSVAGELRDFNDYYEERSSYYPTEDDDDGNIDGATAGGNPPL